MSTELIVALVSSGLTAIIGPIIVHFVSNRTQKNNKKDQIKESLEINKQIEYKIEEIARDYEADRVWIAQFHNGGYFYPTGKSIQKFSVCYELINYENAKSVQHILSNIPLSLFSRAFNELLENNVVSISDVSNKEVEVFGLRYIAELNECKSKYIFAIKSIDGKFIGILGVDYVKDKINLSDHEINSILVEATSIGGVLMNYLLNK